MALVLVERILCRIIFIWTGLGLGLIRVRCVLNQYKASGPSRGKTKANRFCF